MKGLYPLFVLFPLPCSGFLTAPKQQQPLLNEIDHAGCPFLGHDILSGSSPSYGYGVFFTKLFQRMGRPKRFKLYGLGEPFTSVFGKETVKEVLKDEPKEEGGAARIDMRPYLVQSTPLDIIGRAREQRDVNEKIVENIKLVLAERGITPVLITIGGSRAKGVASDAGSDYDTNVIGLHTRRDYLLQKVNPSFRFTATDVAGIDGEVEGVVSDYVKMQRYILDNNMKAYDTFAGITAYTTPLAEEVRKIHLRVFESARLASSLRGMLFGYRDKRLSITPELQGETTYKLACEAVYLAMKLLYIESSASMGTTAGSPPPYEITELMDKCRDNLSEDEREWIRSLVDSRIANKTATFVVTEKFCELIDRALRVKPACSTTRTTTTGKKERAGARIALEDLFLCLFS